MKSRRGAIRTSRDEQSGTEPSHHEAAVALQGGGASVVGIRARLERQAKELRSKAVQDMGEELVGRIGDPHQHRGGDAAAAIQTKGRTEEDEACTARP